jgi:hypothetical protein
MIIKRVGPLATSPMKLSLCNEVVRELPFDRQCELAAELGYQGLELAPFTLGEETYRMLAPERAAARSACANAGIAISGLHWLLVAAAATSCMAPRRSDGPGAIPTRPPAPRRPGPRLRPTRKPPG